MNERAYDLIIGTGEQKCMMNPSILPSHLWEKHTEHFRAIDGKIFQTNLITKKLIRIQFFRNCVIRTKIFSSDLPDKNLLIGFDILHTIKKLQITVTGVYYKRMFKSYIDILCLYTLTDTALSKVCFYVSIQKLTVILPI